MNMKAALRLAQLAHLSVWALFGVAQAAPLPYGGDADEVARETRQVDARVVRVRLEGIVTA
jgi:hypothetical protein